MWFLNVGLGCLLMCWCGVYATTCVVYCTTPPAIEWVAFVGCEAFVHARPQGHFHLWALVPIVISHEVIRYPIFFLTGTEGGGEMVSEGRRKDTTSWNLPPVEWL